jgi:hypothetical protein
LEVTAIFDNVSDQVTIRRYVDSAECDVVVVVRGQVMMLRCRDYNQAVRWADIEMRSYKIPHQFSEEWYQHSEEDDRSR